MNTFVLYDQTVVVPDWVRSHTSFRKWVRSDQFPETGRICYLNGEVWVDMSQEQFFSHNQVKSEFNLVLGGLAKHNSLGRYIPDGMLISNPRAGLTAQPDGSFVSHRTLRAGRVRLIEGVSEGFLELEGTPDTVLEVISSSSVTKDTETLMELYWKAGIPEYWLVDARSEKLQFDIYQYTPDGYVPTRKPGGWVRSKVFPKTSFRLTRRTDELGNPDYSLSTR